MEWRKGQYPPLAALRSDPAFHVVGLLTSVTPAYDRVSIHGTRRSILHAQSRSLELPVFEAALQPDSSNADYETAWAAALHQACAALGPVRHIAYGDLFLEDVRRFREGQAQRHGFAPVFPIWGQPTDKVAHEFVRAGYKAYVTCVDTTQLAANFAGREFDNQLLSDLPQGVDPCGERGEFHTCVVNGPLFRHPIPITVGERVTRNARFEYCDLVPVSVSCARA